MITKPIAPSLTALKRTTAFRTPRASIPTLAALTLAALALTGCVQNGSGNADSTAITVDSSATDCTVSASTAPSGTVVFSVTNSGDQATEFYLLGDDGKRVVGEVENIGPGTSRDLVATVETGDYFTVCKPGMGGDGVGKAAFTVTDAAKNG